MGVAAHRLLRRRGLQQPPHLLDLPLLLPAEGVPVGMEAHHDEDAGGRRRVGHLVKLSKGQAGELLPLGGVSGAGGVVPRREPGLPCKVPLLQRLHALCHRRRPKVLKWLDSSSRGVMPLYEAHLFHALHRILHPVYHFHRLRLRRKLLCQRPQHSHAAVLCGRRMRAWTMVQAPRLRQGPSDLAHIEVVLPSQPKDGRGADALVEIRVRSLQVLTQLKGASDVE
mmetsp:Transcript_2955/g.5300  ORF Transcript_2955/g.5300 Transcript_2955/m.5300 type:complete len:225 (-) Transcript_2955:586-1260(-)